MSSQLRVCLKPAQARPSVAAAVRAVARCREPVVLDSAAVGLPASRYTILACEPTAVLETPPGGPDPFVALQQVCRSASGCGALSGGLSLPFVGGWIGYLAYEAGRYIESLPASTVRDIDLPVARFSFYPAAAVHDAHTGSWTVVAARTGGQDACPWDPRPTDRLDFYQQLLAEAAGLEQETPAAVLHPSPEEHNLSFDQYLRMVQAAREYIAAGDVFQVNLARRETLAPQEPPVDTYLRLRQANPGAYAAFLAWGCSAARQPTPDLRAILCSSPELFLQMDGTGQVATRPIKGTRPRSCDPRIDAALRTELAVSAKDRAELAMIVDLERNDLGRVCEYGSVRVRCPADSPAWPYELESHATVHHLVATVTGRLAAGRDRIDLLRACFPGGSITGAPKVRAMEIIDELEPTQRSVYTGAIGFLGLDGSMVLNIAIRTLIVDGRKIHLHAGGGIVADSQPFAEYEETVAKARGLRAALGLEAAGAVPCPPGRPGA